MLIFTSSPIVRYARDLKGKFAVECVSEIILKIGQLRSYEVINFTSHRVHVKLNVYRGIRIY